MSDLGGATRVRRVSATALGHRARTVPDQPVPPRTATRVLVLDVDERAAGAVREVLAGEPDLQVVRHERPAPLPQADVVVIGCRTADAGTVGVVEQLAGRLPQAGLLVLATEADVETVLSLTRAGVRGVLLRSARATDLVASVQALRRGDAALSPQVTRLLLDRVAALDLARAAEVQRAIDSLTPRQRQVLSHVADGASNHEIAAELGMGHGTVKAHLSLALERLGCRNRAQAAVLWQVAQLHAPRSRT